MSYSRIQRFNDEPTPKSVFNRKGHEECAKDAKVKILIINPLPTLRLRHFDFPEQTQDSTIQQLMQSGRPESLRYKMKNKIIEMKEKIDNYCPDCFVVPPRNDMEFCFRLNVIAKALPEAIRKNRTNKQFNNCRMANIKSLSSRLLT